ncbi:hypothetical protein DYD21_15525 [Rhodohalobacter sp. SW132]|uniref:hypothetical protein n=1 Tax=Rhodohalobacter sp. SW132 TaxID=2293433 RepID=UPI000E24AE73|nr:hypothetical protein [Rhodohalobacter sp. SW132]REL24933.1 hypothetical protein DYD21_15525 [Rhodohalobacter sp. SW132]
MKSENSQLAIIIIGSIAMFVTGIVFSYNVNINKYENLSQTVDLSGGEYVRLVFIGSSDCYFSNNTKTNNAVNGVKKKLYTVLNNNDIKFISTGISFDISSEIAISYLSKSGKYDEILVGAGAFNLGAIKYVSGSSATPTILIFRETYNSDLNGLNIKNLENSQRLIKTYIGQLDLFDLYDFLENATDMDVLSYLEVNI